MPTSVQRAYFLWGLSRYDFLLIKRPVFYKEDAFMRESFFYRAAILPILRPSRSIAATVPIPVTNRNSACGSSYP